MDSTQNLLERLEQLHRIGAALSRERDINHLLDSILEAAKRLLGADGQPLPPDRLLALRGFDHFS